MKKRILSFILSFLLVCSSILTNQVKVFAHKEGQTENADGVAEFSEEAVSPEAVAVPGNTDKASGEIVEEKTEEVQNAPVIEEVLPNAPPVELSPISLMFFATEGGSVSIEKQDINPASPFVSEVVALPNEGFSFVHWTDTDGTVLNVPANFTPVFDNQPHSYTAHFAKVEVPEATQPQVEVKQEVSQQTEQPQIQDVSQTPSQQETPKVEEVKKEQPEEKDITPTLQIKKGDDSNNEVVKEEQEEEVKEVNKEANKEEVEELEVMEETVQEVNSNSLQNIDINETFNMIIKLDVVDENTTISCLGQTVSKRSIFNYSTIKVYQNDVFYKNFATLNGNKETVFYDVPKYDSEGNEYNYSFGLDEFKTLIDNKNKYFDVDSVITVQSGSNNTHTITVDYNKFEVKEEYQKEFINRNANIIVKNAYVNLASENSESNVLNILFYSTVLASVLKDGVSEASFFVDKYSNVSKVPGTNDALIKRTLLDSAYCLPKYNDDNSIIDYTIDVEAFKEQIDYNINSNKDFNVSLESFDIEYSGDDINITITPKLPEYDALATKDYSVKIFLDIKEPYEIYSLGPARVVLGSSKYYFDDFFKTSRFNLYKGNKVFKSKDYSGYSGVFTYNNSSKSYEYIFKDLPKFSASGEINYSLNMDEINGIIANNVSKLKYNLDYTVSHKEVEGGIEIYISTKTANVKEEHQDLLNNTINCKIIWDYPNSKTAPISFEVWQITYRTVNRKVVVSKVKKVDTITLSEENNFELDVEVPRYTNGVFGSSATYSLYPVASTIPENFKMEHYYTVGYGTWFWGRNVKTAEENVILKTYVEKFNAKWTEMVPDGLYNFDAEDNAEITAKIYNGSTPVSDVLTYNASNNYYIEVPLPKYDENNKVINYELRLENISSSTVFSDYTQSWSTGTTTTSGPDILILRVFPLRTLSEFEIKIDESCPHFATLPDTVVTKVNFSNGTSKSFALKREEGYKTFVSKADAGNSFVSITSIEAPLEGYEFTYDIEEGSVVQKSDPHNRFMSYITGYYDNGKTSDSTTIPYLYKKFNAKINYNKETTHLNVKKVWKGISSDQTGLSVKIILEADGEAVDEVLLSKEANNWEHTFDNLPVYNGNKKIAYTVKEVELADYDCVIEYVNDTEVVITNTYHDQIIDVRFRKVDADTNKLLEGVKFKVSRVLEGGELIDEHNTTTQILTDENGVNYSFEIKNLREGSYVVSEVEPLKGYNPIALFYFSVVRNGSKLNVVSDIPISNNVITIQNKKEKVYEFSKQDVTTKEELSGAKLQLKDEAGSVISEWTSTDTPHKVKNLTPGKYILSEVVVPAGYLKAQDVEFIVNADGTVTGETVMYDNYTKIRIIKVDEEGNQLEGAKFQILDEDGTVIIDTFEAGSYLIEKTLEVGKTYFLHEVSAPEKYSVLEDDVKFTVLDTSEVQEIKVENKKIKQQTEIKLTAEKVFDRELVGDDFEFTLSDDKGNVIQTVKNDKDGNIKFEKIVFSDDDAGKVFEYVISEVKGSDETIVYDDNKILVSVNVVYDSNDKLEATATYMSDKNVLHFENTTKPFNVSLSKQDITTKEELPGAKLQVKDKDGIVIDEWISTNVPHLVEDIKPGKYTLVEVEAPEGYLVAEPIEFTVNADGTVTGSTVLYDDYTKLEILKVDENDVPLSGATLRLVNSENVLIKEWVSTNQAEIFNKLPAGIYTLTEVSVPAGYLKAGDIKIEIKESAETVRVKMVDKKETPPETPPEEPLTPPDTPPETPPTPPEEPPVQPETPPAPPEEPPLVPNEVLGVRRVNTDDVLGARRGQTSDKSMTANYAALVSAALAALLLIKKKKKD